MLVQTDFLNKTKEFGLNSYEAKIWIALLSRGISTAGELSDIANVPRSRSYDVLESLEKKGFVILKLGKPIKYIAVNPEEMIERVKKRIHENTLARLKILDEISNSKIIEELNLLYKQGIKSVDIADLAGVIRGRTNLYNTIESMIKRAKKSILIATTEQELIKKAEHFKNVLKKAKDSKVEIKIIAPITKNNEKEAKQLSFVDLKNKQNKARFCIIDGKEILLMISEDSVHPSYDSGIWINAPSFAAEIEKSFV